MASMDNQALAEEIIRQCADRETRYLIAIAGPPGAGKTTLGENLHQRLGQMLGEAQVALVPMDGFHLSNATLDAMGERHRKGAPHTFDAQGFVNLVRSIQHADDTIVAPGFDRAKDAVVAGMHRIPRTARLVLIEGNYLLLDQPVWRELHDLFDMKIIINPGIDELERRLIQRWLDHGHTPHEARDRAMSNDIPNAKYVLEHSIAADIELT